MKKKNSPSGGLVYSTDPNFRFPAEDENAISTPVPGQQKLRIRLDTRNRGGKAVTLVQGFVGTASEADELGKKLKTFCGTGGAVKDFEIIVQGDNRDKVLQWLIKNGFTASKKI
ncbi:MAG: translation initiation factor [Sphingobacteriales bacterium]|jgi:translation initiation factor 1|nr:translation initiation factor [Sphingobacteriales bacterium]